ncbi:hypothetical protein H4R26_004131 [Coemansia thaxteri]|uniref:AB hydrolase-1 domain-containing protein n=1 Tax=Coemansia thaxteri TaxID=2663907 RepID=A0A9W8EDX7_9FUNG|nr:hypothetical protein H4R26_004131 [Coemansia thaxteri]KAJ2484977.1 hypothetical protein EV174_002035 [Coemansia sp. RSA 2320]
MICDKSPTAVAAAPSELLHPPWLLASATRSGTASLSKLWPWAADPRSQNGSEHALLAQGDLVVATPATPSSADARPQVAAEIMDVDIDSHGNYIHTLAIRSAGQPAAESEQQADLSPSRRNLVLTHGYFSGVGYFFRNYRDLSQVEGWDVYAIDWLGMGRSSRPAYKSRRQDGEDVRVAHAEQFFVESLEEWRKRMRIDKMTLCGHSFGGYMSALYALKYPQHVEKLVLISPIGLPEAPPDLDERLKQGYGPAPGRSTTPPSPSDLASGASNKSTADTTAAPAAKPSMQRLLLFRTAISLWDRNYTPQWAIRSAGPFGRRLIDMYIQRFTWLTDAQRAALAAYAHQISVLPASSESALNDILRPAAYARRPLVNRLDGLAMPTIFMYGSHDWVDHAGGQEVIRRLAGRVVSRLHRVPHAGHNLHLENPSDFNRLLIAEMAKDPDV